LFFIRALRPLHQAFCTASILASVPVRKFIARRTEESAADDAAGVTKGSCDGCVGCASAPEFEGSGETLTTEDAVGGVAATGAAELREALALAVAPGEGPAAVLAREDARVDELVDSSVLGARDGLEVAGAEV
jgi:hypothetical protein